MGITRLFYYETMLEYFFCIYQVMYFYGAHGLDYQLQIDSRIKNCCLCPWFHWQEVKDFNLYHAVLETAVLPITLTPH